TPDDVRLILIDPKRIELSHFESVPHLLTPVVSSPKEASAVLANCLAEMERRYERLSSVRARNINEANRAFRQRGEPTLPYVLVVIDELADLMMVAPQAVEDAYVSEEEIALVVEQTRQREQELDESYLELPEAFAADATADGGEHGEFDPDDDPLLDKAIEIVVQTQTASVSLLQRRLRVGYTRAGRLVDMLERRGIISGYEGSKPRRVLVDENQLERVSG